MQLKHYLDDVLPMGEREAFCKRCETTWGHMRNVSYGDKPCGIPLAVSIERETGGEVTRQELRPEDYWLIWPDLTAPTTTEA